MAQITKQKVLEMAVTLAAGVLSNTANGRMIIDSYSGISNTLQDCVTAIEGAAFSLGYEVVLELEEKPYPQMYYCANSSEQFEEAIIDRMNRGTGLRPFLDQRYVDRTTFERLLNKGK